MIQDIFPHHLINHFESGMEPLPDSFIIGWQRGQMLMKVDRENKTFTFPRYQDLKGTPEAVYLFTVDEDRFFLCQSPEVPEGFEYTNLRDVRRWNLEPRHQVFAAFTALQLAEWYEKTAFCGRCGHPMLHHETERARICPDCGNIVYPRINPAVIVGVVNGDHLLLTRYRNGGVMNALVAGFTEIGETLEETVSREVMEEAGVHVKNIRYYKSQPWGIASDILAGFYCEVDGDPTIHMDDNELKYAEWVKREDIILQPADYSLTNEMMQRFRDGFDPFEDLR